MLLFEKSSGQKIPAKIEPMEHKDFKEIKEKRTFGFNWELEKDNLVFKILRLDTNEIVGLMSILDFPRELRIEINLIEASKDHVGKNKRLENIAGCLIAYACKISFEKGYLGFVSLIPKTELINHYIEEYGFRQFGNQLAIQLEASEALMLKFL